MNRRLHPTRLITLEDKQALVRLLRRADPVGPAGWPVFQLRQLLRSAAICAVPDLPDGTVRLGSSCAVWMDHLGELIRFTLSLPHSSPIADSGTPLLSPVGLAVLGYCQGSEVLAPIPGGMGRFRIFRVSPPPPEPRRVPERSLSQPARRRHFARTGPRTPQREMALAT